MMKCKQKIFDITAQARECDFWPISLWPVTVTEKLWFTLFEDFLGNIDTDLMKKMLWNYMLGVQKETATAAREGRDINRRILFKTYWPGVPEGIMGYQGPVEEHRQAARLYFFEANEVSIEPKKEKVK